MDTSLPVIQVKESHGLRLDPEQNLPQSMFTLIVATYPRMTVGDRLIFTWQGYFDDGTQDVPLELTCSVISLGQPIVAALDSTYVMFIADGHAEVSYRVEYADAQGGEETSAVQTFAIVAPVDPLLPAVAVSGHTGEVLDPEAFPEGALLQISAYPGMQVGDDVLVYASSSQYGQNQVQSLRVDQAMIDAGELLYTVEQAWLRAQLNETVTFAWQYARLGRAGSSAGLALTVRAAWRPAAPIIVGALPEPDSPAPNQGYIEAMALRGGATVKIPEEVELKPGDVVQVHWQGCGSSGQYIATTPDADDPRQFFIPASAVPANMGKRLDVMYTVDRAGEPQATSQAFDLRVVPVPLQQFRTVQCQCVDLNKLRLSCVPDTGAQLTLGNWIFMAAGQRVTIKADSVTSETVLDELPVTEAHLQAREVTGSLRREYLESLGQGTPLGLKVWVSFDEGHSQTGFPSLSLVMAI